MAILALTTCLEDLRQRLGRIVIGFNDQGRAVTAEDLKAAGAMTVLLGEMRTMPGLPSEPNAWKIDLDKDGNVIGLF